MSVQYEVSSWSAAVLRRLPCHAIELLFACRDVCQCRGQQRWGTIQVTQVIEAPGGLRMIWATGYFCDLQGTLKKRLGLCVITHGRAAPRGEEVKTAREEMPINTPR